MSERFDTFGVQQPTPDPYEAATAEPDTEPAGLDPREAAALLEQTQRRARRSFEGSPLLLMLAGTATVLIVYGALWLSVRHEHPYTGPAGWALGVLYGTLAVWIALVVVVRSRAASGVGGRAARERRLAGITFAVVWISVYVLQGALYHAGASKAIAYGIYPATAPLIVVGGAAAAYAAARERWADLGSALTAVAIGAGAAFAGPRAAWLVVGIGLAAIAFSLGAVRTRQRRAGA